MRKKWLGVALMVFSFASVLFYVLNRQPPEPTYEGKPISSLIEEGYFQPGDTFDQQGNLDATKAILNIGTNGLPYYISCLDARDSRLKLKMLTTLAEWNSKHHWTDFNFYSRLASTKRWPILAALEVLQTNAMPAAPALVRLARDSDGLERSQAIALLVDMGPASVSAFKSALATTNGIGAVLAALGDYGAPAMVNWRERKPPEVLAANAKVVVPILVDYIRNTNKPCRETALVSLGSFCMDPKSASKALPIFAKCCQEPDSNVRRSARQALKWSVQHGSTNALNMLIGLFHHTNVDFRCEALDGLKDCGAYAITAAPEIAGALDDQYLLVRKAATNALQIIDPTKLKSK